MDDLPPSARDDLPNARWLQALSIMVLVGFGALTAWVLANTSDQATHGALIQTWNNAAIAVVAFWLGSSSGGKRK